jgi:hypothetical protein
MKRKQTTIEEMLKKKRPNEDDEDYDRINVTAYLMKHNNITQTTTYDVSTMAKVYFRDHSNIDEVLDRYMEQKEFVNANKEHYLPGLIQLAISDYRSRRNYPLNMFKFESDYHESIAKFLLMHPGIATHEDLQETNFFLVQNGITHCQVSMDLNNKFRDDEQEYINRKKERVGYQNLKQFLRMGSDHALRQYNQKHNLLKRFHIDEITLEEMCEISTIERLVRLDMKRKKTSESLFEGCINAVFKALKDERDLVLTLDGFYVHPQYLLITNNLTLEQEQAVTERKDLFYAYTNAKDLLALNRRHFPVSNENADAITKRTERRRNFWFHFIRLIDKKQHPFNNLLWTKEDSDDEYSSDDSQAECAAGPSNINNNVWKKKPVAEKSNTTQQPLLNNNEATIAETRNENLSLDRFSRSPKEYLAAAKFEPKYTGIIKFLLKENEVIEEITKCIAENPDIATAWRKNSQLILWNFIHFNLEDKNENFLNLLIKCCSNTNRVKLDTMLKEINIHGKNFFLNNKNAN